MTSSDPHFNEALYKLGYTVGTVLESKFPARNRMIPHEAVDPIANAIQMIVAEAIQAWIDAGSERDAVMENEQLHNALVAEVFGWSDHPDNLVQANGDRDVDP